MIERTLIRIAIAAGAAWWLARVVFSRSERGKLDLAMQAVGEATVELRGTTPTCRALSLPLPQAAQFSHTESCP